MELFEVIGIQHKVGTYQGQPFDNMVFSVTTAADVQKGEFGLIASQIKVKTSLLTSIPTLGDIISPVYDRFGRVVGLTIN